MQQPIMLPAMALILAVAPIFPAVAQESGGGDPIAVLEAEYRQRLEDEAAPLRSLQSKYVENLEKLKGEAQAAGRLDEFVAIEREIQNHAEPGERDFSSMPMLRQLREIYERANEPIEREALVRQASVHRDFARKCGELARTLTQRGQVELALRAAALEKEALAGASASGQQSAAAGGGAPADDGVWRLETEADVSAVDVEVELVDGNWILSSTRKDNIYLESNEEFQLPITISARASTDSSNIRFYFRRVNVVILNWEVRPDEMRLRDPLSTTIYSVPGGGSLNRDQMHDIEIDITRRGVAVRVDGRRRGEVKMDLPNDLPGTVGIGPAVGSKVTVESLEVRRQ